MAQEDTPPHALVGRAGLVFAYVAFAVALATFAGAIYLLPIPFKAKLFLAGAVALLTSMFVFTAIAAHVVLRPRGRGGRGARAPHQKEVGGGASADAKGSHRPR